MKRLCLLFLLTALNQSALAMLAALQPGDGSQRQGPPMPAAGNGAFPVGRLTGLAGLGKTVPCLDLLDRLRQICRPQC